MLSDRRQRVLSALIEEYVAHAMPVGSRTLTERYRLGVSSATVRNDLSALEDAGYITQPHTSAGRIPTDAGYRAFVDDLLASDFIDDMSPYQEVVDELRSSASELDALMAQTSAALTRLTDCLSIVTAPSVISAHIRQLSLISLTNYRALIVIVTEDGQALNRQLAFAEEVAPDDLAQVQNLLGRLFVGKSMREVRREFQNFDPEAHAALHDPLVQYVLDEILVCLQENNIGRSRRGGMSALMQKPEFSSSSALLPVMRLIEDDASLLHVFEGTAEGESPIMVRIGGENAFADLAGVSVIASTYGRGEGEGVVAVIGPTRMDYSRVIRAVRAAESILRDE